MTWVKVLEFSTEVDLVASVVALVDRGFSTLIEGIEQVNIFVVKNAAAMRGLEYRDPLCDYLRSWGVEE